jgi:hypothetical protein
MIRLIAANHFNGNPDVRCANSLTDMARNIALDWAFAVSNHGLNICRHQVCKNISERKNGVRVKANAAAMNRIWQPRCSIEGKACSVF